MGKHQPGQHRRPQDRSGARRIAAERLRHAKITMGAIRMRLQPMIHAGAGQGGEWAWLTGVRAFVTVDEAIDVEDLWAETLRFWQHWRPARRRTATSEATVRQAWECF